MTTRRSLDMGPDLLGRALKIGEMQRGVNASVL
jgi:hypothetical protein